jgi:hypothetical protein
LHREEQQSSNLWWSTKGVSMAKPVCGVPAPEWWKHLRPFNKRRFWKKVRRKVKIALAGAR